MFWQRGELKEQGEICDGLGTIPEKYPGVYYADPGELTRPGFPEQDYNIPVVSKQGNL